jgi:phenylpyruvate tautomerase PptA (4-oxalocrotonate tautomerase family)
MPTVIVYWSPGRTAEQKKRISQRIYETFVEDGGAKPEDVLIIFQNIEPGDASRPGLPLMTSNFAPHSKDETANGG